MGLLPSGESETGKRIWETRRRILGSGVPTTSQSLVEGRCLTRVCRWKYLSPVTGSVFQQADDDVGHRETGDERRSLPRHAKKMDVLSERMSSGFDSSCYTTAGKQTE